MSDLYTKARVTLLNDTTGDVVSEVEIVSNSKEIFYDNPNPTLKQIGTIPEGTTFDKTPISDIIDGILYENVEPSIISCITSNGDINELSEDTTIVKPVGTIVDSFTVSVVVKFGTRPTITVTLTVGTKDNAKSETVLVSKPNNSEYKEVNFDISNFSINTDIVIEVGISKTPTIHYKFISPIYIGWAAPELINSLGELDKKKTEDYFQSIIDHDLPIIETTYVDKSNQSAMTVPGINYDNRERLNPCILIPQSWGELRSITDINGNNIFNSYANFMPIDIRTHDIFVEHYIAYISRQTFDNDEDFIRAITYVADESVNDVNMDNYAGEGIPLTVGFSLKWNAPLDQRSYMKTYGELLKMLYPYPGLQTYVEDINTTFRYEKGHWTPVSTKTHVVESADELTVDFGGWDDSAIDASTGKLYKKRYNNIWELWWEMKVNIETKTIHLELPKEK